VVIRSSSSRNSSRKTPKKIKYFFTDLLQRTTSVRRFRNSYARKSEKKKERERERERGGESAREDGTGTQGNKENAHAMRKCSRTRISELVSHWGNGLALVRKS
jgi:erythromycin esterase-like protein